MGLWYVQALHAMVLETLFYLLAYELARLFRTCHTDHRYNLQHQQTFGSEQVQLGTWNPAKVQFSEEKSLVNYSASRDAPVSATVPHQEKHPREAVK
jgi:hypothetical protein